MMVGPFPYSALIWAGIFRHLLWGDVPDTWAKSSRVSLATSSSQALPCTGKGLLAGSSERLYHLPSKKT